MQATVQLQAARRSLRSIWYLRVRCWSRNGPLVAASAHYMATSTANAHVHIRIRRTHAQTERRRTHAKTERRSCRLILPSPMLLRCSFAAPKLPSTYNRTHGTMKEEHNERAGGERGAERRLSHIAMQVTHANLLLRSSPAYYRTYQRDPKVHWPGWPADRTSRPRARRRGRRAGPREVAVLVTPTLPILPPPPPVSRFFLGLII